MSCCPSPALIVWGGLRPGQVAVLSQDHLMYFLFVRQFIKLGSFCFCFLKKNSIDFILGGKHIYENIIYGFEGDFSLRICVFCFGTTLEWRPHIFIIMSWQNKTVFLT